MFELSITDQISSAHYLNEYEGKCKNLHGHNYKVELVVISSELDNLGMVSDFGVLKSKLHEILSEMDHVCLNDLEYFKDKNPTTENIAKYVFEKFAGAIAPLAVKYVKVWESDNSSVCYYQ